MSLIKNDIIRIFNIFKRNFKNLSFWIWFFFIIYFKWLWFFFVIFYLLLNIYVCLKLFFTSQTIIILPSKFNFFYFLNVQIIQIFYILKLLSENKTKKSSLFFIFFFRYLFLIFTGITLKFFQLWLSIFDEFCLEWVISDLKNKKKSWNILSTYFGKSLLRIWIHEIPLISQEIPLFMEINLFFITHRINVIKLE